LDVGVTGDVLAMHFPGFVGDDGDVAGQLVLIEIRLQG
jgi:hypothetical protein